jgi:hypothetical protein
MAVCRFFDLGNIDEKRHFVVDLRLPLKHIEQRRNHRGWEILDHVVAFFLADAGEGGLARSGDAGDQEKDDFVAHAFSSFNFRR